MRFPYTERIIASDVYWFCQAYQSWSGIKLQTDVVLSCRRKVFLIIWTTVILVVYITDSLWSTLIKNEKFDNNNYEHITICNSRKVSYWLCDIINEAFISASSIVSGANCEILDPDLSDEHTTVITHERMAAVRRAFNQCVIQFGEHSCLVLLFDDDFFWE